jgi:hypothetical protein
MTILRVTRRRFVAALGGGAARGAYAISGVAADRSPKNRYQVGNQGSDARAQKGEAP